MITKRILPLFVLQVLFLINIQCETTAGRSYTRFSSCRSHKPEDDDKMMALGSKTSIPIMDSQKPKSYLGTVGILGGAVDNSGAAHYAGIAALRVGADDVHIYCMKASAAAILSRGPDINVHPLVDTNWNKVYEMISKHDVIVIGPGLEMVQHNINVITALTPILKNLKKPIVFDLNEFFLTPQFVTLITNYPPPGIVMTPNAVEFEKLYLQIKSKNAFSDAHVHIDFPRIGPNLFVYRKGCTDMGMSVNPMGSWSLSTGGSPRRVPGQGSVIAGATAIYWHWAIKMIETNTTTEYGPMVHAAIGTHLAARLMRDCNRMAYDMRGNGALTSDMIPNISEVLYGMD